MFKQIFANSVYIKVYQNRFDLRQIESGVTATVVSSNTFSTSRILVGHFVEADTILRKGMKQLHKDKWFTPKPVVIIQPMEKTEGGLSQVEERILKELATGAGARKTLVWVGHELSDNEVIEKLYGV
ncbi:MAG: 1-pyrroline-5-carboxylate dehydrogenase [Candidatus Thiodiazotropha sp. (ex Codakia rugifera)]|nr:1-pyrroline-5-carboxylate dehydrogenase [Candidatus Thiodiazotropha sp. (ex Codakia rugifera)]